MRATVRGLLPGHGPPRIGSLEPDRSEQVARLVLAAAVFVYVMVALRVTRGASFTFEEFIYVGQSHGFDPHLLATPFGGHLTAVTRLFYEISLRLFGPTHFPFQLFVIVLVSTVAVLRSCS